MNFHTVSIPCFDIKHYVFIEIIMIIKSDMKTAMFIMEYQRNF